MCALDFERAPPKEIAIIGDDAENLLNVVFGEYRPHQVVALGRADVHSAIPLLDGRERIDGKATAYVCQKFACQMPVTERQDLAEQLSR